MARTDPNDVTTTSRRRHVNTNQGRQQQRVDEARGRVWVGRTGPKKGALGVLGFGTLLIYISSSFTTNYVYRLCLHNNGVFLHSALVVVPRLSSLVVYTVDRRSL